MKKILFLWAVLFCIGTTALGHTPVVNQSGNVLSEGIHRYNGTLSVTALDGATVSYTGKEAQVDVYNNTAIFTLFKVPLTVATIRVDINDITVDPQTGIITSKEAQILTFFIAIPGHVYGNTLTNEFCDLEFDVLNSGTDDFLRMQFVGNAVN